jgi:hypothetical protein
MSPSNNLSEMSFIFIIVHIKVIEYMVHEDIALFQKIWEQTDEEQGEASLLNKHKYFQCHEDINMGWINMGQGVL